VELEGPIRELLPVFLRTSRADFGAAVPLSLPFAFRYIEKTETRHGVATARQLEPEVIQMALIELVPISRQGTTTTYYARFARNERRETRDSSV
jgi:hypothetical protein